MFSVSPVSQKNLSFLMEILYFSLPKTEKMSLWRKNTPKTDDPEFVKYRINDLKFFAKDEWFFAGGSSNRIYRTVFTHTELNETGLFAELSFYNKLFDEADWSCNIRYVVDKLKKGTDEVEKHIIDDQFHREISRETNLEMVGRGKVETGFWKEGEYIWRAFIDGQKVKETRFYVYDYPHPDANFNPFFEITGACLFESGFDDNELKDKRRLVAFQADETRFINIRLELRNKLPMEWQCELFFYFQKDTGDRKSFISRNQKINVGSVIWNSGRGNDNKQFWTPGKYTVNIVFMDRLLASIPFEVGDAFEEGDAPLILPNLQPGVSPVKPQTGEIQQASLKELLDELNLLVGMQAVKEQINDYVGYLKFARHRNERGIHYTEKINLHAVFTGNPGTGKTTVAKMLGGIYKALGLLSNGHVHEVDRADLVGEFIGQTAPKVKKAIERARGGVLFIDEAYSLVRAGNDNKDFGPEVIEILLKEMSDGPGDIAIFAAGYPEEMKRFIEHNPGMKSRFNTFFHFADYTPDELMRIAESALGKRHLLADLDAKAYLLQKFTEAYRDRDKSFGNARFAISVVDEAKMNMALRLVKLKDYEKLSVEEISTLRKADLAKVFATAGQKSTEFQIDKALLDEAMNELNALTGLRSVKENVQEMVKLVRYYRETGRNVLNQFAMHALYVGNPGTGKTTVARIMAKIFRALGVIERGHLVECDRESLVAGYAGQTATKTAEMVEKSLGGVLFVDEAYALQQGHDDSFGREAVNTLLKRMEDLRDEFIVIAAGYPANMNTFLDSNPGLRSRFEHTFRFDDYNGEELFQIGIAMLLKENLIPSPAAEERLRGFFADLFEHKDETYFGNAREVRKVIQAAVRNQHLRMASLAAEQRTEEMMETLEEEDLSDLPAVKREDDVPAIGFKR